VPVSARDLQLGSRLPWFSVTDLDGRTWDSASLRPDRLVLVAFLCRHSPYVVHLEEHFGRLARTLEEREVTVIAIAPNDARAYPSDGPQHLAEQAANAGFSFPYCLDEKQQAAKAFGASCTPEFFLYDLGRRLVYHGQYDGSRPGSGLPVTGTDLLAAVDATLAGDFVHGDQRPSFGCSIKWAAGNEPSYLLA